jgi:hypothetical protein
LWHTQTHSAWYSNLIWHKGASLGQPLEQQLATIFDGMNLNVENFATLYMCAMYGQQRERHVLLALSVP